MEDCRRRLICVIQAFKTIFKRFATSALSIQSSRFLKGTLKKLMGGRCVMNLKVVRHYIFLEKLIFAIVCKNAFIYHLSFLSFLFCHLTILSHDYETYVRMNKKNSFTTDERKINKKYCIAVLVIKQMNISKNLCYGALCLV
jgi:hypothetical protein